MENSLSQSGLGSSISIGTATTTTPSSAYTLIGEVSEFPLKFPAWKTAPTTHLKSTTETAKPVIPGLTTIEVKGNRVSTDAGQTAAVAAYKSGRAYDFKIQLPPNVDAGQTTSGDSFTFSAFVLEYTPGTVGADKIIEFSMTLQYDGNLTEVAGA